MLYNDEHNITVIRYGRIALTAIYKGSVLLWQAVTHLSAWFRSQGWFRSEPW